MNVVLVQPLGHRAGHYTGYTHRLTEALLSKGCGVELVSARGFITDWPTSLGVPHHMIERTSTDDHIRPESRAHRWWSMLRVLKRGFERGRRGAVVHFMDYEPVILSLLNRSFGRPTHVLTLGGFFDGAFSPGDDAAGRFYRTHLWNRSVRDIARNMLVVTHSEPVARRSAALGLVAPARTAVIPSGIMAEPRGDMGDARKQLGLAPDSTVLLAFGTQRYGKGFRFAVEAMQGIDAHVELLVVGAEWKGTESAGAVARRLGVNITELAQFVDDGTRRRCFDAADAVLLPYMRGFEGQSEVLFDAASAAIPVIASDSGEVGRMVRHHQLGLTFEPENATSLRQTMGRFSQLSCADRAAIREQLRAFAAARSWLHVAEEHIRVYAACQVAA